MNDPSQQAEEKIRTLHEAGDMRASASLALEVYGDEVFGFLLARLRAESDAAEVFSDFCEDLWRGLPKFSWRSSCRTWLYVLARHAAARYKRHPNQRADRRAATGELSKLAEQVRSRTKPYLQTGVKDAFAEIRASLDPDDQNLLILRVDRRMPWRDLAIVWLDDISADDQAIEREAARLRKRFQLLKGELRRRAAEAGLLESAT